MPPERFRQSIRHFTIDRSLRTDAPPLPLQVLHHHCSMSLMSGNQLSSSAKRTNLHKAGIVQICKFARRWIESYKFA